MFNKNIKMNIDELTDNIDKFAEETKNYLIEQPKTVVNIVEEENDDDGIELDKIGMIKIHDEDTISTNTENKSETEDKISQFQTSEISDKNKLSNLGDYLNSSITTNELNDNENPFKTKVEKVNIDSVEQINIIKTIAENGTTIVEKPDEVTLEIIKNNMRRKRSKSIILAVSGVVAGLAIISGIGLGYYFNQDLFKNYYASIVGVKPETKIIEGTSFNQEKLNLENRIKQLESEIVTLNTSGSQNNNNSANIEQLNLEIKKLNDKKTELEAKVTRLESEKSSVLSGMIEKTKYDELSGTNKNNLSKISELEIKVKKLESTSIIATGNNQNTGINSELQSKITLLEEENKKIKEQLSGTQNSLNKDSLVSVESKDFYEIYAKDLDYLRANVEYSKLKKYIIKINLLMLNWDKKEISYDLFRKEYNLAINEAISLK